MSKRNLVEIFANLFNDDSLAPATPDEIDSELRAFGYDPDALGKRIKASADEALKAQAEKLSVATRVPAGAKFKPERWPLRNWFHFQVTRGLAGTSIWIGPLLITIDRFGHRELGLPLVSFDWMPD